MINYDFPDSASAYIHRIGTYIARGLLYLLNLILSVLSESFCDE